MGNEEIAVCVEDVVVRLQGAELHEAVTVLVCVASALSRMHSVTLADVGFMFAAGVKSGCEFLERGVH